MSKIVHQPVLLEEVLSFLSRGGIFVDGTLGSGGHSLEVLKQSKLKVIGIDRDPDAVDRAKDRLKKYKERTEFWVGSYADLKIIAKDKLKDVSMVLLDLGYSSDQMSDAQKGLSFMKDGPLDMRYDQTDLSLLSAADIINGCNKIELERILKKYGEERFAKRIVNRVLDIRRDHRIKTTKELREIVERVVPIPRKKSKINPATKTFQALRIAVNKELDELKLFLDDEVPKLPKGCVVAIISFHSLEDRLVKRSFKNYCIKKSLEDGTYEKPIAVLLNKKIIVAGDIEVSSNVRSRSAKMRVLKII